ncbi:MAG: CoA-binding protein [Saprospiraceae bacterium]|nr:CoA-binding protein [Saprospiraceae bacterium]
MPTNKKTIVIGASSNPERSVYKALSLLKNKGHEIYAIGKKEEEVHGIPIHGQTTIQQDVDTITIYLNAANQQQYYPYILSSQAKRIIFNPGAENPELKALAQYHGIQTEDACTLVLLQTGQY